MSINIAVHVQLFTENDDKLKSRKNLNMPVMSDMKLLSLPDGGSKGERILSVKKCKNSLRTYFNIHRRLDLMKAIISFLIGVLGRTPPNEPRNSNHVE